MANFISEDNIEMALIQRLITKELDYHFIHCDPSPEAREALPDGTGRSSKKECVLPEILRKSLVKINPEIAESVIDSVVAELRQDFTATDLADTNYTNYRKIRDSVKVPIVKNGKEDVELVRLIDFEHPLENDFTVVNQMWIQGHYNFRRPDVLIFVNGLPVVFIELKNSTVKVEEAYNKNLSDYLKDVPNLFAFNQICVLSNGLETRLGAFNATYDHFFEWLKVDSEKERPDRKAIAEEGVSLDYFARGLLKKETLIDYIENFIIFDRKRNKIIAKNHQFFGVNNLMDAVIRRKELNGKLGVFWHTQGSGKSYSMVMFTRKVKRKLTGNFSFLIITDREDLDDQIHKNFVRTEVIGDKEECQPKNSEQLRQYLTTNKPFIFTLIHKFRYDKTKKYPVLTTRDDLIVLVDEAHRTQYKDLAENMRTALPNASFVAFTGTPLLGPKRLTNHWFGDYVSEYDFTQSVEDGSTVPIFYSRRVPEVWLQNNDLDTDVCEIIENQELNEAERTKLENSGARVLEVIKRDDRLDKVARDIAHHFPRRGFLGKAMVVSVDKFTTVQMYNKVMHYLGEEKKQLVKERNDAKTQEEKDALTKAINYLNNAEYAVILSDDTDEGGKFEQMGVDMSEHRAKMAEISPDGKDIEDRFKDPSDKLQMVFVCAMWLTGFDVPSLSTLYLDKPAKDHTLMQTITRVNRKFPGKSCGMVIDYINIFGYMKRALGAYATGSTGSEDYPVKDIDALIALLNECIDETDKFLQTLGISIGEIIKIEGTFEQLDALKAAYNIIIKKQPTKDRFRVLSNTMTNLYEASKPEIFEKGWYNSKFAPLKYLNDLFFNYIDDEKLEKAKQEMSKVLDNSVASKKAGENNKTDIAIHEGKVIDLTNLDVSAVREKLENAKACDGVMINDLKEYIEATLQKLINQNTNRINFAERYKRIIDTYNAGGSETEKFYEDLQALLDGMKDEAKRAAVEGLTEEELEIYDLLTKGRKLTKAEEVKVKLASKNLYEKLSAKKDELLVVDWYKDDQPVQKVQYFIQVTLNEDLPESYDQEVFKSKTKLLLDHFIDMAVQGYGWIAA